MESSPAPENQGKVRSRFRRWLQFPLWALLLSFVPVGFGSLWLRDYMNWNRPIAWKPYSDTELDRHLANGRSVLVYVARPPYS